MSNQITCEGAKGLCAVTKCCGRKGGCVAVDPRRVQHGRVATEQQRQAQAPETPVEVAIARL